MTNDILKPWARWMVNHKLKWLLTLYSYLLLPIWITVGILSGLTAAESVMEWAECINELENVK
jgi:hypothetical protein